MALTAARRDADPAGLLEFATLFEAAADSAALMPLLLQSATSTIIDNSDALFSGPAPLLWGAVIVGLVVFVAVFRWLIQAMVATPMAEQAQQQDGGAVSAPLFQPAGKDAKIQFEDDAPRANESKRARKRREREEKRLRKQREKIAAKEKKKKLFESAMADQGMLEDEEKPAQKLSDASSVERAMFGDTSENTKRENSDSDLDAAPTATAQKPAKKAGLFAKRADKETKDEASPEALDEPANPLTNTSKKTRAEKNLSSGGPFSRLFSKKETQHLERAAFSAATPRTDDAPGHADPDDEPRAEPQDEATVEILYDRETDQSPTPLTPEAAPPSDVTEPEAQVTIESAAALTPPTERDEPTPAQTPSPEPIDEPTPEPVSAPTRLESENAEARAQRILKQESGSRLRAHPLANVERPQVSTPPSESTPASDDLPPPLAPPPETELDRVKAKQTEPPHGFFPSTPPANDQYFEQHLKAMAESQQALLAQANTMKAEAETLRHQLNTDVEHRLQAFTKEVYAHLERERHELLTSEIAPQLSEDQIQALAQVLSDEVGEMRAVFDGAVNRIEERVVTMSDNPARMAGLSAQIAALSRLLGDRGARAPHAEVSAAQLLEKSLAEHQYRTPAALDNGQEVDCLVSLSDGTGGAGHLDIVVDFSFPLDSYSEYLRESTTPEAHDAALARFVEYAQGYIAQLTQTCILDGQTTPSVVMYIPSEDLYAALHSTFPQITEFALQSNVWIASPTTLAALLHTLRAGVAALPVRTSHSTGADRAMGAQITSMNNRIENLENMLQKLVSAPPTPPSPQQATPSQPMTAPQPQLHAPSLPQTRRSYQAAPHRPAATPRAPVPTPQDERSSTQTSSDEDFKKLEQEALRLAGQKRKIEQPSSAEPISPTSGTDNEEKDEDGNPLFKRPPFPLS